MAESATPHAPQPKKRVTRTQARNRRIIALLLLALFVFLIRKGCVACVHSHNDKKNNTAAVTTTTTEETTTVPEPASIIPETTAPEPTPTIPQTTVRRCLRCLPPHRGGHRLLLGVRLRPHSAAERAEHPVAARRSGRRDGNAPQRPGGARSVRCGGGAHPHRGCSPYRPGSARRGAHPGHGCSGLPAEGCPHPAHLGAYPCAGRRCPRTDFRRYCGRRGHPRDARRCPPSGTGSGVHVGYLVLNAT